MAQWAEETVEVCPCPTLLTEEEKSNCLFSLTLFCLVFTRFYRDQEALNSLASYHFYLLIILPIEFLGQRIHHRKNIESYQE